MGARGDKADAEDLALRQAFERVRRISECGAKGHPGQKHEFEAGEAENGHPIVTCKWECEGCGLRVFTRWPIPETAR